MSLPVGFLLLRYSVLLYTFNWYDFRIVCFLAILKSVNYVILELNGKVAPANYLFDLFV